MNVFDQVITDSWALYHGDCIEVARGLPDDSIDFCIHSPPFSNLYIYSDSIRDMGNASSDEEFMTHYGFLIKELFRITVPGRLCAVHCKDLPLYKGRDGAAGLRDFPGRIIAAFEAAGWTYHSRVTIWKDPVIEMQRTKNHGLLYKQLCKDSAASRQGMADYLVVFRKWTECEEFPKPVTTGSERFDKYVGTEPPPDNNDARHWSIQVWQRYASPVWMDIRQTNVLNYELAKDASDEKHICPLQLDVIERAIHLWTNPGDLVFTPFAGIGSELYQALLMGRRAVGAELKESYWRVAVDNCRKAAATHAEPTLFGATPAVDQASKPAPVVFGCESSIIEAREAEAVTSRARSEDVAPEATCKQSLQVRCDEPVTMPFRPDPIGPAICDHDRLNEDGQCRECGADCRGGVPVPPAPAGLWLDMTESVSLDQLGLTEDEFRQRYYYPRLAANIFKGRVTHPPQALTINGLQWIGVPAIDGPGRYCLLRLVDAEAFDAMTPSTSPWHGGHVVYDDRAYRVDGNAVPVMAKAEVVA